jgi:hypothetical protein
VAKTRRAPDDDVRSRRPDDDDAPRKLRRRDDEDDIEDDDEGPFRPKKKRESVAGPTKLVLKICAAVAGAALLILLLYWVYSPVGTDHALLCYFPKETVQITGYDVDEGSRVAKMKEVHDMLLNNYKQFGDRRFGQGAGVSPTDVAKYLSGQAAGNPEEEKDLKPQDRRGSITVIRFRKDVDRNQFTSSFNGPYLAREQRSRDGKVYHQLSRKVRVPQGHEEEEDDISFFFPNARTLVYTSTRRECEEALTRVPGRVVVEGHMRELADKVDGHFFQAGTGFVDSANPASSNTLVFGLGIVDPEIRENKGYGGPVGTASWFASNGNDFLYASATLYGSKSTARDVRAKLAESFYKAQAQIYQSEGGTASGLEDPFNPKQPKQGAGAGAGGGFAGGGGGTAEGSKDILEALTEYVRTARVRQLGRMVVVEGSISHGTPEQGTFEKFWRAAGTKFSSQQQGFGFPGGGFPGPGGMGPGGPPPGMIPGNVPVGPGR